MSYQLPAVSPPYVIIGSDYSAQEPRITAFISQDPEMIKAFKKVEMYMHLLQVLLSTFLMKSV